LVRQACKSRRCWSRWLRHSAFWKERQGRI